MVTRLDRDVGRILDKLSQLGVDERTIVFLCSDNGAGRTWDGLFDSCGQMRGKKGELYEGGIRTPMVVRWPGQIPCGAVSDAVWYFADFLPTAVDLAGAGQPACVDGISIVPTLLGPKQDLSRRHLYWEYFGGGFSQAVRTGNWKAVRKGLDGHLELYDLSRDPAERKDLSGSEPDIVRGIEEFLMTARTDSHNYPIAPSE